MAAKNSSTKNSTLTIRPPGSCANSGGKVLNTSAGPLVTSTPYVNTLGNMANPANIAIKTVAAVTVSDTLTKL